MYEIESMMKVPRLTPGRRLLALRRMRQAAATFAELADLAPPIEAAIAAHEAVIERMNDWRRAKDDDAMHAREAKILDQKVDRAMSALYQVLRGAAEAFEPDDPRARGAQTILEQAFPRGVAPITSLPFVDQHEAVAGIVRQLRGPALREVFAWQGLADLVDRIEELNTAYGAVLTQPERLSWDALRAEDRDTWLLVVGIWAQLGGAFSSNDPDDLRAREAMLRPFRDQEAELAKLRARRAQGVLDDDDDAAPDVDDTDDTDDAAEE